LSGAVLAASLAVLLPAAAWAGPAVDAAVAKADLRPSDPLEVKIEKTLGLLVNRQYFSPNGIPKKLPPPYDENNYHLDSLRTPEQILTQKIGGYCNNFALVFSAMLERAGVPAGDMRVVAAVNDDDLAVICPEAGAPRAEHPRTGASGHVFVEVKGDSGRWRLINTVGGAKSHQWTFWLEPDAVAARMRSGPLPIPSKAARGSAYKPMTVFAVWRGSEQPLHTFEQRLNLIASGTLDGKLCRYGPPSLARP
jgi:Transglutaminase-like superfamily